MATGKDINSNKNSDSNNSGESDTRKSSKMNKIAWIAIIVLLFLLAIHLFITRPHHHVPSHVVIQRGQLRSIDPALELFKANCDGYPPSDALDPTGQPYCGAMKLCEAMMGLDLLGFHQDSVFKSDGMNAEGTTTLYSKEPQAYDPSVRTGPYMAPENANAYRLKEIYTDVGPFDGNNYVICDVYTKRRHLGKKIGMPILYYKADTSRTVHDVNEPNNPHNVYKYKDNHALLALGVPGKPAQKHPLHEDPKIFYEMTRNYKVTTQSMPKRADTYILLSAGLDGLYGTEDDIVNFDMRWKPK